MQFSKLSLLAIAPLVLAQNPLAGLNLPADVSSYINGVSGNTAVQAAVNGVLTAAPLQALASSVQAAVAAGQTLNPQVLDSQLIAAASQAAAAEPTDLRVVAASVFSVIESFAMTDGVGTSLVGAIGGGGTALSSAASALSTAATGSAGSASASATKASGSASAAASASAASASASVSKAGAAAGVLPTMAAGAVVGMVGVVAALL